MKIGLISKLYIIYFISLSMVFTSCDNNVATRSLFSWKDNEVLEGKTELFETMNKMNINTLYQNFSIKLTGEQIKKFLIEANEIGVEVYLLDGDPTWALSENGKQMIETINRVNNINMDLEDDIKIKSIVFDIEPYLLKEWGGKNNKDIMNTFINGMKIAYKKANESELGLIVCIPYYYDNMGFSNQLEELIQDGSDSIAIMNYLRDKEAKNMEYEVELANKHGKNVINIYELQKPGIHSLKEKNTYYNLGINSVENNFNNILEYFPDMKISIAFHEYRALKEVLDFE